MGTVYLAGEIYNNWRKQIFRHTDRDMAFPAPVTNQTKSDHKGVKINTIQTRNYLEQADRVVVFSISVEQYNMRAPWGKRDRYRHPTGSRRTA